MTTPFRSATNTTTSSRRARSLRLAAVPVALVTALGLAGCGKDDSSTASSTTAAASKEKAAEAGLTMSDAWVKTTTEAKSAAFGVLHNAGDADVVVTGVTTPLTSKVELHETVASADGSMKMQPKAGGFTVPAGGDLTLQPGGDHIMLMDLSAPITAGEDVSLTLQLKDGSTVKVTATAKDFTGANEKYEDGSGGSENGGMHGGETTTTVKMG